MFLTYQLVTLTGISYEQLKFTVTYAKLKSLGDKRHRQICHASSAEYREKKNLQIIAFHDIITITERLNFVIASLVSLMNKFPRYYISRLVISFH